MNPFVLMILDGWGFREASEHNAIAKAKTPHWDHWWATKPHCLLDASGATVGLPENQMGNSEVGHMHIGSGRRIEQDLTQINHAIIDGTFDTNPIFLNIFKQLTQDNQSLHIMGLLSPGGVHSHEEHLFALLKLAHRQHFNSIHLHLFLDGRDTPPQSAKESLIRLNEILVTHPVATITSMTGRFYAMDRDKRWERIKPVYDLLTQGDGTDVFENVMDALEYFYQQGIFDEFIPPTRIGVKHPIKTNDALLFFNFRADRARQLTQAFMDPAFSGFQRLKTIQPRAFITMTPYDDTKSTLVAFPNTEINNTLGEILSKQGLRQLRIAETEKYAHVTFFFNGGKETPFCNETRCMIPSPPVLTYDKQPEMSAKQLTEAICHALKNKTHDVIICNFANADMVGHTGNLDATIKAIECLDKAMASVWEVLQQQGGHLLITADHGNAESMFDDATQQPHTAHTNNLVPCLFLGEGWHFNRQQGALQDIAPTILSVLGINPPKEMTGTTLLEPNHE